MGESVSLFREPDAGNLPVRFDEREQETEPGQTGLRGRGETRVAHPPGGYRHCTCSRLYSPVAALAVPQFQYPHRQFVESPDCNLLIFRLLSPLVGTTKVYSGTGADIVMESLTII